MVGLLCCKLFPISKEINHFWNQTISIMNEIRNTNRRKFLILLLVFLFTGFQTRSETKGLTIYIFLSETCPICQSVAQELKKLHDQYSGNQISFNGIFPDKVLSNPITRQEFAKKYSLNFVMQPDSSHVLTQKFHATITPEVVVVDNESLEVIYRGKIDNSFASIGKRRTVVTEFYLRNVLESWHLGKKPVLSKTQPVGCIIQK